MSSRRQRSIPLGGRYRQVSLYKKSFQGPNANNFNRGYKSLVSDKTNFNPNQIIHQEGDTVISDTVEICETFNNYFTFVPNQFGSDDTTPTVDYMDEGFLIVIIKYCRHHQNEGKYIK